MNRGMGVKFLGCRSPEFRNRQQVALMDDVPYYMMSNYRRPTEGRDDSIVAPACRTPDYVPRKNIDGSEHREDWMVDCRDTEKERFFYAE